MSFTALGLSEPILRAVASEGYSNPTPIQAQSIPHVMEGRDLLGCAQTGTGKTAAFALPVLHRLTHSGNPPAGAGRRIRVLVLAPTRELALQISESFSSYGRNTALRNAVIFGGVGQGAQVQALKRGVDIVVATPGRLNDLMEQGYIDLRHLQVFVLDEADRMLDIGFLPDIRRVMAKLPPVRQTLFFSATMPPEVRKLADDLLSDPVKVEIAPVKATAELIDQSVCFVPKPKKVKLLAAFLKQSGVNRSLVFARTKHGADRISQQLMRYGIRSDAIHGNKSQNARQRTLDRFRTGKLRVLVATDLAARGIDVDDVTHVFNYDLPNEPETYVHRIGRTGRAGASGQAIAFCDPGERSLLKSIERLLRKPIPVLTELPTPVALPAETEQVFAELDQAVEGDFAAGVEIHRPARERSSRHHSAESSRPGTGDGESAGRNPRKRRRRRRPEGAAAGAATAGATSGNEQTAGHSPRTHGKPTGQTGERRPAGSGRGSSGGASGAWQGRGERAGSTAAGGPRKPARKGNRRFRGRGRG